MNDYETITKISNSRSTTSMSQFAAINIKAVMDHELSYSHMLVSFVKHKAK